MSYNLKQEVKKRFLDDCINKVKPQSKWKVLLVDSHSTRVISSVIRMTELTDSGVTVVERLNQQRQRLATFEAIYIIYPCLESFQQLIEDFKPGNVLYKGAHIFTLTPTSEKLFTLLAINNISKYILTFLELNLNFLAIESQVFSLDEPLGLWAVYSPHGKDEFDRITLYTADQLATLFSTLGQHPYIGYLNSSEKNLTFAEVVHSRLQFLVQLGAVPSERAGHLVILDRGADLFSPVLHELTYQAMLYDCFDVKNNMLMANNEAFILDENDPLWCSLRHLHIADLSKKVAGLLQDFKKREKEYRPTKEKLSAQELATIMRKLPSLKEEGKIVSFHYNNAALCMTELNKTNLHDICEAEQNVAFQMDSNNKPIKNTLSCILPLLRDPQTTYDNKLRLVLLYLLRKRGVSESELKQLLDSADIANEDRIIFRTLPLLGGKILNQDPGTPEFPRAGRHTGEKYSTSRWTPFVWDVAQAVLQGSSASIGINYLDPKPTTKTSNTEPAAQSRRKKKTWISQTEDRNIEKVVIFIIGGITYSEMRSVYEISKMFSTPVLIGSTNVLTSKIFLQELKDLDDPLE